MRERAFQAQVRAILESSRERWNFRSRNAQAIHARIDLQVKTDRAAARLARTRGSRLDQFELLVPHDGRRTIVFENALFFSGTESREDQDWFANAAFT